MVLDLPSTTADGAVDPQEVSTQFPFFYEVISPAQLESFDEDGRQAVLAAYAQASEAADPFTVCDIFQELSRAALDQKIEPSVAGSVVKDLVEATSANSTLDPSELFLDTISILPDRDISNPRLVPFVAATAIPPSLMRLNLEEAALRALGLTRETFGKMFIRKQTHILYRQSNYNLLREETEGYAKLMTELFTVSQPDDLSPGVVSQTLENVKALIGAFDLDAGRVLDVTLDVFSSMLVKNTRFFVKLLRASPFWPLDLTISAAELGCALPVWALPSHSSWDYTDQELKDVELFSSQRDQEFWQHARSSSLEAFFGLGGRKILNEEQKSQELSAAAHDVSQARAHETLQWVERTGTAAPSGNSTAAQLLGFKLRFYSSSARDKDDSLPPNIMQLTALLIKIGFISLRDLYTHLYPDDEGMATAQDKERAENARQDKMKSKGESAGNALAMAGALPDDTVAPVRPRPAQARTAAPAVETKPEEQQEDPLPDPANQKVELLRNLLLVGALPEALYILGRFPWIIDVFRDLPKYTNRLLNHSIDQVYASVCPRVPRPTLSQPTTVMAANQKDIPKPFVRLTDAGQLETQRWATLDQRSALEQDRGDCDMKFYWDDWARDIPVCRSVDDIFTLCDTLLNLSGVRIGQDQVLLSKLVRIGKASLAQDNSSSNHSRWINLLKRIICPAVSFLGSNCLVIREVWEFLRLFPTQTRYAVYAEWFQGATSRLDVMKVAFGQAQTETKSLLKRINKENVREKARDLAKLCAACPGVVFDVCLRQIESYDNLITVIIECARYFTELSYDVLSWTLMSFLGREGRSRVSDTGFKANRWLQSLSTFTGQIYKRYALMEPYPILLFILERIRNDNFVDLRILRDIITGMAGIVFEQKFTEEQLQAMAGGDVLRKLTLRQLDDQRHNCGVSAKRLIKTLVDNDLAGAMLIAVAQQRQTCIYVQDHDDNKILGEIRDETVAVLTQYLDLLLEYLPLKEFAMVVPSVAELMEEYGIDGSIAFTIHRKNLSQQINDYDAEHRLLGKTSRPSDTSTKPPADDIVMASGDEQPALEEAVDATATDVLGEADEVSAIKHSINGHVETGSHPVLESLNAQLERLLAPEVKSTISIPFYTSFWQLDLSDIVAHKTAYDEEHKRQRAHHKTLKTDKNAKVNTEAMRIITDEVLPGLETEAKAQIKRYSTVRNRLKKEMHFWFRDIMNQPVKLHRGLLQECFMPRVFISALDAQFAQRMLFLMLELGVPGFSLLHFISTLFHTKVLQNLIFQCTLEEAENMGRFLHDILKIIGEWHANKATFESKAWGPKKDLPGFAVKFSADGKPLEFLDYEEFRRTVRRWHQSLYMALRRCILSAEYMHARNGIAVLSKVSSSFPVISFMIAALAETLETVGKREQGARDDLSTAAFSARTRLPKKPQLVQDKHGKSAVGINIRDFCIETNLDKESTGELVATAVAKPSPPKQTSAPGRSDVSRPDSSRQDAQKTEPTTDRPSTASSAGRRPDPSERPRESAPRTSTPQHPRDGRSSDESLKRKPEYGREHGHQSPATDANKRARLDEAGHALSKQSDRDAPHSRAGPANRPHDGLKGEFPRPSETMQPPSMPRSERSSFRSSDGPRGPRHQDPNYGRLNQDLDLPPSPPNAPGRLSRSEWAPPPNERRQPSGSVQGPRADDRGPIRGHVDVRSGESAPSSTHSPAPSTPLSETALVHPSRLNRVAAPLNQTPPRTGRTPPPSMRQASGPRGPGQPETSSGFTPRNSQSESARGDYGGPGAPSPTTREPPSGPALKSQRPPVDGRHQFAQVRDTLRQSGPSPNGPRGGHSFDGPPLASPMGRGAGGRYTERSMDTSRDPGRDPDADAVSAPKRKSRRCERLTSKQDLSGRPPRDPPRYGGDRQRGRDVGPSGNRMPMDRGPPSHGRAGNLQGEGQGGPPLVSGHDHSPMTRAPMGNHGPPPRAPPSYGNNYHPQGGPPRQYRDDRGDNFGAEADIKRADDRRGRGSWDDVNSIPRQTAPAESRPMPQERGHSDLVPPRQYGERNAEFGGRPVRGPFDESEPRSGDRPLRRGPGRELMSDASATEAQERVRPPPPRAAVDPRERGSGNYGRGDGSMPQRGDMRGGPSNRRGGGQPRPSDGRPSFPDGRGDRRSGEGFGHDRREGMNGSGPAGRKREWDGEGAQGDGKRAAPPRRPMNQ